MAEVKFIHYFTIPGLKLTTFTPNQIYQKYPTFCVNVVKTRVCEAHQVSISDLESKSRKRDTVLARHMFCYMMRWGIFHITVTRIAKHVRGMKNGVPDESYDHTTVLHSSVLYKDLLETGQISKLLHDQTVQNILQDLAAVEKW